MLRNEWKFNRTAVELAEAAKAKNAHHLERMAWWEDQKAKTMAEVKESGIEVSESLATQYSNTSAMGGPQVMVRNDLQKKPSECHTKIQEHDKKAREYDGWAQVMTAAVPATYDLNNDDWLYFFGQ